MKTLHREKLLRAIKDGRLEVLFGDANGRELKMVTVRSTLTEKVTTAYLTNR